MDGGWDDGWMEAEGSGAWKMDEGAAEAAATWNGSAFAGPKGGAKRLKRLFSEGGVAFNGDHNAIATCKSGTDQSWACESGYAWASL